jgi:receptor protein-tyrosine kinase
LRANLKFFEANRNITSILVTSALPREGKTITAINLSLSLAMSGSRVVVVEGDLRRPMLQKYLELKPGLGLSNILAGTHAVADVVQTIDTSAFFPPDKTANSLDPTQKNLVKKNLLCIAAGPLPPNPAELLGSDRAAELLKELAALCDYVIIDGPPLLLVSDALELAKKVDGVLLVGRLRSTTIDEARKTRVSLRKVGVLPLGVVVSGATRAKAYQRRYGDYYAET